MVTKGRRKHWWLRWTLIGLLSVYAGMFVRGRILGPVNLLDKIRSEVYRSWHEENEEAFEQFKRLAKKQGWKVYVRAEADRWSPETIARFDLARFILERYTPPKGRSVLAYGRSDAGRMPFIESGATHPGVRTVYGVQELCMLCSDGRVMRFPVDVRGAKAPLASGNRWVLFGSHDGPRIFNVETRCLQHFGLEPYSFLEDLAVVEDKLLLVLASGRMDVLRAGEPYLRLSSIEGVWSVISVGQSIVIGREWESLLYDPTTGQMEPLAAGKPLCSFGDDEFLLYGGDAEVYLGRMPLYRYNIVARKKQLLWRPGRGEAGFRLQRGQEKSYDHDRLIVSPDRRFLFMPWRVPSHKMLDSFEYEVYDLQTGEKRGSFLNLYEGELFLEFFGWAETGSPDQRTRAGDSFREAGARAARKSEGSILPERYLSQA